MNLPDIIFGELRDRILNRTWNVGEKLPSEMELSREFNVNRLTIRLAITKLNTLGIVETRTGEGTFVKKLDLYNYVNQIVPFVISNQEISHVLDFEKQLFSMENDSKLEKNDLDELFEILETTKEFVEIISKIYIIKNNYDDESVTAIVNSYWRAKEIIISKSKNMLLKSIYFSLKDMLIEYDINSIKNMKVSQLNKLTERIEELVSKREIGR